jgi:hypothetical protein
MSRMPNRTNFGIFRLLALVVIFVIGQAPAPGGSAASIVGEDVISIRAVSQQPGVLHQVTSRLTVPAQTYWETDPDAGPLTLTVETGSLSVELEGGLARVERVSNPLTGERIGPLPPGQAAVLSPGDRLVVVRGFQLTATNDEQVPATAVVVRLRQPSDISTAA